PSLRLRLRNTSTISSHSVGLSPAMTSSRSSRRGRVARARATSRRLRSGRVSEDAGRSRLEPSLSFSRMETAWARAEATPRSLCKAPTMTLSSTESPAKGFTIWKVRPTPAAHTWSGRSRSILFPQKKISPESGGYTPAMTLKIVVLPAPFGPIRPLMSPSGTVNEASRTARRPRNAFEMFFTSSIELQSSCGRGPYAVGQEHDHGEQHDAVEHLLHARNLPAERGDKLGDALGEQRQHRRAEDRAEERAEAADDRPEDDLDRAADVEDLLGEEVVVVEREEHPRHRGHRRAQRDRVHLPAEGVDAQGLRRLLVFADRLPVVPGLGFQQEMAEDEGERDKGEDHVVVHERRPAEIGDVPGVALRHAQEHAARAADPVEMVEADARELGEGDGEEREIHPRDAEAEGEKADRHAQQDRHPQPGPRADAVVEEDRTRRVRADADVERMAERELPGEAHHHVPCLAGVGEVKDQRCDRERVGDREKGKNDEEQEQGGEADLGADQAFFPSRPCGRSSSTRMSRPKLNMLFAEGAMKSPATASETPISTPPRSAPPIDPSPPTITMTKARSV